MSKPFWRCSLVTRTKCRSWRSSKAPTIPLTTLLAMRPGKTIKAFYKVTWHKNARGTQKEGGNIPTEKGRKNLSHLSFFPPLLFCESVCPWLCGLRCVCLERCGWFGRGVRWWAVPCLPSPMSTYTHTLGLSGNEEGIMAPTDPGGART